jgi:hypothetical protein
MYMTTTYEVTSAPKHADFHAHDCLVCGHSELSKPVWLKSSTGTVFAAGSGCAAKALYGNDLASSRTKARNAYAEVQHAADIAEQVRTERMERFSRALADFNADNWTADLISAQRAYHAAKPGVTFPEFIAEVAAAGLI